MTDQPGLLLTIIAFLLAIPPLIFLHELGHYLVGRWCGVKAEAFSIGFGPELYGFVDRRGTRWRIAALPLGGYVRFAGDMNPAGQPTAEWLALPPEERSRTFPAKAVWQRALIVFAGPAMNFLIAFLILGGFGMAFGEMVSQPIVDGVAPNSTASAIGLRSGDRISAIAGRPVSVMDDVADYARAHAGDPVPIRYVRAGREVEATATIGAVAQVDRFGNVSHLGQIGILGRHVTVRPVGLFDAPRVALHQTGRILSLTVQGLGQIISGRRSIRELGGPLATARVAGEQLSQGAAPFIFLIALVSINLGLINLFPIPTLDGGHLLFYAVEAVRRRPVTPAVQEWAFRGGLAAILLLMLVVSFNDLDAFGLWRGLRGLIG